MARYCPLFSGSSGNCTYLGTPRGGILIDAGVSAKKITQALCDRAIDLSSIQAIFITHEHTDHIAGLRVLLKQHPIPLYATNGTLSALLEKNALPAGAQVNVIGSQVAVADLFVSAFSTPHDSAESCGYRVVFPDERIAAIATDIGHVSDSVREAVAGADLVHIESNHDVRMLECGRYPFQLKTRILGRTGHLSNDSCAAILPLLVQNGSTRFVLSHLSREHNTPQLARVNACTALSAAGATEKSDYLLAVASPEPTLPVVIF